MLKLIISLVLFAVFPHAHGDNLHRGHIYRDIEKDAPGKEAKPQRLKLKKHADLNLGRVAGVWGRVGQADTADSFFLGKTPDKTRLQFSLSSAPNTAPTRLTVIEKNGSKVNTHHLQSDAGESMKVWLTVSGSISVQIDSIQPHRESVYAAYFWYPGDRLDGLSAAQINTIEQGKIQQPTFIRKNQGEH